MSSGIAGKRVLVTGGGAGIGAGAARELAGSGAFVGLADINTEAAAAVATEIEGNGGNAVAIPLDTADSGSCDAAAASFAEQAGGIDVLFHAAGILQMERTPVVEMSNEEWSRFIDINLTGTFYMCRSVIPHMQRGRHGTIVLMASGRVVIGGPGQTAYAASKGGVASFTRSLAWEVGGDDITVNTIIPGVVATEAVRSWVSGAEGRDADEMVADWAQRDPLGSMTTPANLGSFVAYLATDGHFITGNMHTLRVYTT
jgi:NAD(P)-dependent dehydrogenase (short-subunit alcohol dehydrogenase family)